MMHLKLRLARTTLRGYLTNTPYFVAPLRFSALTPVHAQPSLSAARNSSVNGLAFLVELYAEWRVGLALHKDREPTPRLPSSLLGCCRRR